MEWLDWKKIGHNALVFLAPLAILYLGFVTSGLQNGFSFEAFIPSNAIIGACALYILNVVMDFFRKYMSYSESLDSNSKWTKDV